MKSQEEIKMKKEELRMQLRKLEQLEYFRSKCDNFECSKELLDTIEFIINRVEDENYICTRLSKTITNNGYWARNGYYKDDPSGGGGEWVDTGSDYFVAPWDETIEKIVIMKRSLYDIFCFFDFDSRELWETNLNKLIEEDKDKQVCCNLKEFGTLIFNNKFPYICEFLNLLGEYRYQNNSLNITKKMLDECAEKIINQKEKVYKK